LVVGFVFIVGIFVLTEKNLPGPVRLEKKTDFESVFWYFYFEGLNPENGREICLSGAYMNIR
jgi:hypothetical protein